MKTSEPSPIRFTIATQAWEFEQIHRLNYQTFVEEIPQHPANPQRLLVDAFHAENTYVIAVRDGGVVGMVALRGRRPFSLDHKLPDLDSFLPAGRRPCELRLLATTPDSRHGFVFRGLVELVVRHGVEQGYDLAVISGTLRQAKLYKHLGFTPFGPLVGTAEAPYQPMYLTLERFEQWGKVFHVTGQAPSSRRTTTSWPT